MPINEGDFIRLNFTGYVNGILFDTTDEEKAREAGTFDEKKSYTPKVVCVGKHQIVLGLDEALLGKEIGFEETIEVPPEKAFGEHEQELLRSYEKKSFSKKPERGMQVNIPDAGTGTVVNVIGNRVIVDFNHPLAGQTVTYTYRIESIVDQVTEQISGIIKLFTGYDMDVTLEDTTALVKLPPGIYYASRSWLNMKPYVTNTIFEDVKGIEEIRYIENYIKPKKETEE